MPIKIKPKFNLNCTPLPIHSCLELSREIILLWVTGLECGCVLSQCKHIYLFQMHMSEWFVLWNGVSVCLCVCMSDVSDLIVLTPICLPRLSSLGMCRVGIRRFWHSRPDCPNFKTWLSVNFFLFPPSLCTSLSTHTHTHIWRHGHSTPAVFIAT